MIKHKGIINILGEKNDIDPVAIYAVAEVESNGRTGFQPSGLLTVLFEPHVFYRTLKNEGKEVDELARKHPTLISKERNQKLYQGGLAENIKLANALQISQCAWECASYGAFQIMGFNYKKVGFDCAHDMVLFLKKGTHKHIEVFLKFIHASPVLWQSLKNKDWSKFARYYNGINYAENKYDKKLEKAYLKATKEWNN